MSFIVNALRRRSSSGSETIIAKEKASSTSTDEGVIVSSGGDTTPDKENRNLKTFPNNSAKTHGVVGGKKEKKTFDNNSILFESVLQNEDYPSPKKKVVEQPSKGGKAIKEKVSNVLLVTPESVPEQNSTREEENAEEEDDQSPNILSVSEYETEPRTYKDSVFLNYSLMKSYTINAYDKTILCSTDLLTFTQLQVKSVVNKSSDLLNSMNRSQFNRYASVYLLGVLTFPLVDNIARRYGGRLLPSGINNSRLVVSLKSWGFTCGLIGGGGSGGSSIGGGGSDSPPSNTNSLSSTIEFSGKKFFENSVVEEFVKNVKAFTTLK